MGYRHFTFPKHPLFADVFVPNGNAEPIDCWLLLVFDLEPIPASLYQEIWRRSQLGMQLMIVAFRSTGPLSPETSFTLSGERVTWTWPAFPFVNQTNLTFASIPCPIPHQAEPRGRNPWTALTKARTALSPVRRLRLHRWAIPGGVM